MSEPPVRLAGTRIRGNSKGNGTVTETVSPSVVLIGKTEFFPPADVPWTTDAEGGEALAEFAGRACYQSWKKPNPSTATNAGYLRHIL
jgi:thymidylate synthase (FAD)